MNRKRPWPVTLMAIVNLFYGGFNVLGFLLVVVAGLLIALTYSSLPPEATAQLDDLLKQLRDTLGLDRVPSAPAYFATVTVLGGLTAVALFASGIGLWKMHPWGRWLAIVCGVYTLLEVVANVVYTVVFLTPAMSAAGQQAELNNPLVGNVIVNVLVALLGQVVEIVLGLALVGVMFLPSVRAAFRAPAPDAFDEVLPAEEFPAPLLPRQEWQE